MQFCLINIRGYLILKFLSLLFASDMSVKKVARNYQLKSFDSLENYKKLLS